MIDEIFIVKIKCK